MGVMQCLGLLPMDVTTFSIALNASQRDKGIITTIAVPASLLCSGLLCNAIEGHTLSPGLAQGGSARHEFQSRYSPAPQQGPVVALPMAEGVC